ncbi:cell division protein ZipA C-terminal FtsZ-binding domain-containing protein [Francisellaceae bacterium CB300]
MSYILILTLILVVLIVIDLFRKSIRVKQKEALKEIENKSSELLTNQVKHDPAHIKEFEDEYPLLRDGYLLFYFEGIEAIDIKSLGMFLKYYGVKYTDDKVFQKINYNDVIFSVLPDNESQVFESSKDGKVSGIVVVMNFKKLASLEYDVKTCYEVMMDILEALNKNFHGTLMNEHKIRITKRDKQNYLEAIIA